MKRFLIFVVILPFISLAGCFEDPPAEENVPMATGIGPFNHPLHIPLVVRAPLEGESISVELARENECSFASSNPYPRFHYKLVDRFGVIDSQVVPVEPDIEEQVISIPLRGNPPWILMGDRFACHSPFESTVSNIADGHFLDLDHGFDHNVALQEDLVELRVAPGAVSAKAEWEADEFAWRLQSVSVFLGPNPSPFVGTVRITLPDNLFLVQHNFTAFGGHTAYGVGTTHLVPGAYVIQVNASVPSPNESVIQVLFESFQLHAQACTLGFAWREICVA